MNNLLQWLKKSLNEINLSILPFLNGIYVKAVDKFRVLVFGTQLIM